MDRLATGIKYKVFSGNMYLFCVGRCFVLLPSRHMTLVCFTLLVCDVFLVHVINEQVLPRGLLV